MTRFRFTVRDADTGEPILVLIADGLSNKEIAARLSMTEEAVKGQIKNILAKLDARDRTHAAVIGLRNGII